MIKSPDKDNTRARRPNQTESRWSHGLTLLSFFFVCLTLSTSFAVAQSTDRYASQPGGTSIPTQPVPPAQQGTSGGGTQTGTQQAESTVGQQVVGDPVGGELSPVTEEHTVINGVLINHNNPDLGARYLLVWTVEKDRTFSNGTRQTTYRRSDGTRVTVITSPDGKRYSKTTKPNGDVERVWEYPDGRRRIIIDSAKEEIPQGYKRKPGTIVINIGAEQQDGIRAVQIRQNPDRVWDPQGRLVQGRFPPLRDHAGQEEQATTRTLPDRTVEITHVRADGTRIVTELSPYGWINVTRTNPDGSIVRQSYEPNGIQQIEFERPEYTIPGNESIAVLSAGVLVDIGSRQPGGRQRVTWTVGGSRYRGWLLGEPG